MCFNYTSMIFHMYPYVRLNWKDNPMRTKSSAWKQAISVDDGITPILRQDQGIKFVSRADAVAVVSWPCAKFHSPWSSINERFPEELAGHTDWGVRNVWRCQDTRNVWPVTPGYQECLKTMKPNKQLCVSRVCGRAGRAPAKYFLPMEDLMGPCPS